MKITNNQKETLICLIENDNDGEREHFENHISELKTILTKLNPQELVIQELR